MDEQRFGRAIGKKHRCLAGGIATADDDHSFVAANPTFERRRGIVNADAFEPFAVLSFEPAIIGSGRNQNSFCAKNCRATFDFDAFPESRGVLN